MRITKTILYTACFINSMIVGWHALGPAHLHWVKGEQMAGAILLLIGLLTGTGVLYGVDDHNKRRGR